MSSSELVLQALTVFPLTKQHIHRDLMTQRENKAKHIHHDSEAEAIYITGVSGEESHGLWICLDCFHCFVHEGR